MLSEDLHAAHAGDEPEHDDDDAALFPEKSSSAGFYPLAFERQVQAYCGKHALNNAFGEHVFTYNDMTLACDVFIQESTLPSAPGEAASPEIRANHERAGGWYSVEVMAFALRRTFRYELLPRPLYRNPNVLYDASTVGAIVNLGNTHWVALKLVHHSIWLLDSLYEPKMLEYDDYVAYIHQHEGSYPIVRL